MLGIFATVDLEIDTVGLLVNVPASVAKPSGNILFEAAGAVSGKAAVEAAKEEKVGFAPDVSKLCVALIAQYLPG